MSKYRYVQVNGKTVPEHRFLWEQANGPIPEDHVIHHINRVRDDNRLENLQLMGRVEHTQHHGKERRKPTNVRTSPSSFSVPVRLDIAFRAKCAELGVSASSVLTSAMIRWTKRAERERRRRERTTTA